jgi:hypothetical protein
MSPKRKTQRPSETAPRRSEHDDSVSVTAYMGALEHPMKSVIEAMRAAILDSDRTITEGIKWNTASFYCHGWFATVGVRAKTGVQLVLHHGAKVRDGSTLSETISDSSPLLTWLAKDRATITFISAEDFQRKQVAFKKIIKQWVKYQDQLAHNA